MNTLVKQEPTWLQSLGQRVRWAWLAFTAPALKPVVQLEHGAYMDLANRRIVVPGEFHIHAQGNLRLSSDEHVILRSGAIEHGGEGYIFFNTREDEWGNPIRENHNVLEHNHDEHKH